jgi:hypothetical protein
MAQNCVYPSLLVARLSGGQEKACQHSALEIESMECMLMDWNTFLLQALHMTARSLLLLSKMTTQQVVRWTPDCSVRDTQIHSERESRLYYALWLVDSIYSSNVGSHVYHFWHVFGRFYFGTDCMGIFLTPFVNHKPSPRITERISSNKQVATLSLSWPHCSW